VREFAERAAAALTCASSAGQGVEERGITPGADAWSSGSIRAISADGSESLLGDPTKARERLGWVPEIDFQTLINEMVARIWTWRGAMRSWRARDSRYIRPDDRSARFEHLCGRPSGPGGSASFAVCCGRRAASAAS